MSPSDYEGLHRRYAQFLNDNGFSASIDSLDINRPLSISLASDDEQSSIQEILTPLFEGMMHSLFQQKGASLNIEILANQPAQDFISAHAAILDSSFQQVPMSDAMRRRLTRSDYIFSGIKTFHEMNEAFPSLIDENGNRKPFEQFLNDVRKINSQYNANYLRAEYNFVQQSASMAAKWEEFMQDGDRYYLQYRTAGDDHVRPAHAALNGVTLPPSDSFWTDYYPPNGWNCRCTVVQVRKSKYPATPHDEAMSLGEDALGDDTKGIFRFNSGQQQKTMPDYNPYTIRRCNDCDVAKGKATLAKPLNCDLCNACQILRDLAFKEQNKALQAKQRIEAKQATNKWIEEHLPETTLANGDTARRLYVKNISSNDTLIINRTFFSEVYAKNIKSKKLAETMRLATKAEYWIPDAKYIRNEAGRHHSCQFKVFEADIDGVTIEFKVKINPTELIMYNMRIK